MKKKLGLMGNFSTDQKSYFLISQINDYYNNVQTYSKKDQVDIAIFGQFNLPTYRPKNFAHFHFQEAWDAADRTLVAFDLEMAQFLININSTQPKFYFLDDLEWHRITPRHYEPLKDVYNNNKLNIICRSQDHADAFTKAWNRPIYSIINNYNLIDFIKLTEAKDVN